VNTPWSAPKMDRGEIVFAIVTLLFACLWLAACGGQNLCRNSIVTALVSPDGERKAVMFQRDCGATTGFSTHVSVLKVGEFPKGGGNAFVSDGDHGQAREGSWGGPWARMRWLGPARLEVERASNSRVFVQKTRVAEVEITYRTLDR
jgi:hypothetical protein